MKAMNPKKTLVVLPLMGELHLMLIPTNQNICLCLRIEPAPSSTATDGPHPERTASTRTTSRESLQQRSVQRPVRISRPAASTRIASASSRPTRDTLEAVIQPSRSTDRLGLVGSRACSIAPHLSEFCVIMLKSYRYVSTLTFHFICKLIIVLCTTTII